MCFRLRQVSPVEADRLKEYNDLKLNFLFSCHAWIKVLYFISIVPLKI